MDLTYNLSELEWKLSKENAQLKAQLAQAQNQLCQLMFDAAQRESAALGEEWVDTETAADPAPAVKLRKV